MPDAILGSYMSYMEVIYVIRCYSLPATEVHCNVGLSLWHIICNRSRLQTAIQCLGFCTVCSVHPLAKWSNWAATRYTDRYRGLQHHSWQLMWSIIDRKHNSWTHICDMEDVGLRGKQNESWNIVTTLWDRSEGRGRVEGGGRRQKIHPSFSPVFRLTPPG